MRLRLQLAILLAALVLAPVVDAQILTVQPKQKPPNPGASPEADPDPFPFPFPWPPRPPFGPQERRDVFRILPHDSAARTNRCIVNEPTPPKDGPTWPWHGPPPAVPVTNPPPRPPLGTQDAVKIAEYWRLFLRQQAEARDRPKADADWVAAWEKSWKDIGENGSVSCAFGELITEGGSKSPAVVWSGGGRGAAGGKDVPPFGTQESRPFATSGWFYDGWNLKSFDTTGGPYRKWYAKPFAKGPWLSGPQDDNPFATIGGTYKEWDVKPFAKDPLLWGAQEQEEVLKFDRLQNFLNPKQPNLR